MENKYSVEVVEEILEKYLPIMINRINIHVIEKMNIAVQTINDGVVSDIILLRRRIDALEKEINE